MRNAFLAVVAAVGLAAAAMPATATETVQSAAVGLGKLDSGPISRTITFNSFTSYGLTNEHLVSVTLGLLAEINGKVDATNTATGGTAASRRRDITASYQLDASVSGYGLDTFGSDTATQTKSGVPGRGTIVTLGQLNPGFIAASRLTSGFDPFLAGALTFAFDASALFTPTAANDVVFGAPAIVRNGSVAAIVLIYDSAVPEPETWTLLVGGFALTGVAARRRRTVVAA